MIAPTARKSGLGLKTIVRFFRLDVPSMPGREKLEMPASFMVSLAAAPAKAPTRRTLTRAMASAPSEYISLMVSPAAIPPGKGSASLISI